MHLHFERVEKPSSYCDCNITTLSWMGKVPDGKLTKEEEGWKLNRNQYYLDGWLASGNIRGIIGVTYTSCAYRRQSANPASNLFGSNTINDSNIPFRSNYNLRGHRSEVTIVKWNEPYQKLATCDSSGIIFVWMKYEGRWSIELINDRSTPVTDFSWSHDGRMALICYTDGFVLVGSVTGQRYWSSMLNLENCDTTCCVWTPDDQHVLFGTSNGHIIVIGVSGNIVTQIPIRDSVPITCMTWSCEKFKMEDTEETSGVPSNANNTLPNNTTNHNHSSSSHSRISNNWSSSSASTATSSDSKKTCHSRDFTLAVCFNDGVVFLLKNYDDLFPIAIPSCLSEVKMEWSNSGDLLAVCGHNILDRESIKLFNQEDNSSALNKLQQNKNNQSYSSQSASLVSSLISSTTSSWTSSSTSSHCLPNKLFINTIKFYTTLGTLRYKVDLNFLLHPITAMTWGHNDKRIFIATGAVVHIAWITKKVPSLQLLSRVAVFKMLPDETSFKKIHIPSRIQSLISSSLFERTLRSFLPDVSHLRDFVSKPPANNLRMHCTLIRHDDDLVGGSTTYILYLEYLGGLVPILKGKRSSRLMPEFVIYDPQVGDHVINESNKQDILEKSVSPGKWNQRANQCHKSLNTCSDTGVTSSEEEDQHYRVKSDFKGRVSSFVGNSPCFRRKLRRQERDQQKDHEEEIPGTSLTSEEEDNSIGPVMTCSKSACTKSVSASAPSSPSVLRRHAQTPMTRLLNRKLLLSKKNNSSCNLTSLYWSSQNSESESESESNQGNASSLIMRDEYGHVYSLPSPLMKRKCRRKRRSPTGSGSYANNSSSEETSNGLDIPSQRERRSQRRNNNNRDRNNVDGNNDAGQAQDDTQNNSRPRRSSSSHSIPEIIKPESTYIDEMPEEEKLVLVTSNIWGTKFKILGLSNWLPSSLGCIAYRTSVLHLQPRQMTLHIRELGSQRTSSNRRLNRRTSTPVNAPSPAVIFETVGHSSQSSLAMTSHHGIMTLNNNDITRESVSGGNSTSSGYSSSTEGSSSPFIPIIVPMTPVKRRMMTGVPGMALTNIDGQRSRVPAASASVIERTQGSSMIHSSWPGFPYNDDPFVTACDDHASGPSRQQDCSTLFIPSRHTAPSSALIAQSSDTSSLFEMTGYQAVEELYLYVCRHSSNFAQLEVGDRESIQRSRIKASILERRQQRRNSQEIESNSPNKTSGRSSSKGRPSYSSSSRVTPESETASRFFEEPEPDREFVLQNKAPFWNELSQVYQLDFGGRVTQESAKNFQIEHQGNQVCQCYTYLPFFTKMLFFSTNIIHFALI